MYVEKWWTYIFLFLCFFFLLFQPVDVCLGRGVRGNNNNNGTNAEAVRSPTTKTAATALPAEPKTSVAVDIQPIVWIDNNNNNNNNNYRRRNDHVAVDHIGVAISQLLSTILFFVNIARSFLSSLSSNGLDRFWDHSYYHYYWVYRFFNSHVSYIIIITIITINRKDFARYIFKTIFNTRNSRRLDVEPEHLAMLQPRHFFDTTKIFFNANSCLLNILSVIIILR